MSASAVTPGATFVRGRATYRVVRLGCATGWAECSHGSLAVSVVRADRPDSWSECWHLDDVERYMEAE